MISKTIEDLCKALDAATDAKTHLSQCREEVVLRIDQAIEQDGSFVYDDDFQDGYQVNIRKTCPVVYYWDNDDIRVPKVGNVFGVEKPHENEEPVIVVIEYKSDDLPIEIPLSHVINPEAVLKFMLDLDSGAIKRLRMSE